MKRIKKATAAVTALMLIASCTISSIAPAITAFTNIPVVSAETQYSQYTYYFKVGDIKLESESDYNKLKKVSDYKEAYSKETIKPELEGKEECRVAEVPVDVKYNSGFFTTVMDFILDSELTLVGYKADSNGAVQTFDNCSLNANDLKAICMRTASSNTTQTGTILTLLIALPAKYEEGKKYEISINDKTFQLSKTTPLSIWTRMLEPGSISMQKEQSSSDADYIMEIGETVKDYKSLKTVSQYSNAYEDGIINGEKIKTEYAGLMKNKVIEVPMNITKNSGVNTGTIKFDCDPDIEFMGCLMDEKGTIVSLDANMNCGIKTKKILINNNYKQNCIQTGTLVTMLFILPDDVKYDFEYKINFIENGFNFVSDTSFDNKVIGTDGYAMVKSDGNVTLPPVTEPTTTTTTTPTKGTTVTTTTPTKETTVTTTTPTKGTTVTTTTPTKGTTVTTTTPTKGTTVTTTTPTKATTVTTTTPTKATTVTTTEPTKITTTSGTTVTTVTSQTQAPVTSQTDIEIPVITDIKDIKNDRVDSNQKVDVKDYPVNIKCDDVSVVEGMKISPVSVKLKDYNKNSYFHEAAIEFEINEIFSISDIKINQDIQTADTKYEIDGKKVYLYGIDTTKLQSDAELFKLMLDVKENAAPGEYNINMAVSAKRAVNYIVDDGIKKAVYKELSPVKGESSSINIKAKSVVSKEIVSDSVKIINPDEKFYFSHSNAKIDMTGLKVTADIITKYDNGQTNTEKDVDITKKISISDAAVPSKLYNNSAFKYTVDLKCIDAEIAPEGKIIGSFDVFIGQKGDIDLNHKVNSVDGTTLLIEFLEYDMTGKSTIQDVIKDSAIEDELKDAKYTSTLVEFAKFLGDADENGKLTSVDGTLVLIFFLEKDMADKNADDLKIWNNVLKK